MTERNGTVGQSMSEPVGVLRLYRESHHRIAELIAMGCTDREISKRLGVGQRRLSLLQSDPTFQELIAVKRGKYLEQFAEEESVYYTVMNTNRMAAELEMHDRLQDDEQRAEMSMMQLNKISMERADRTGYGKHSTQTVKHDFGDLLDRAITRSNSAKVIEGRVEMLASPVIPTSPGAAVVSGRSAADAQQSPSATRVRFRKVV